jgi:uncharacterized protein YjbI with pentapeptide repeats
MKRLRATLKGSNLIALIALFVALGGTAGAAGVKLITGADIKDRSITGADIKAESLSGSDLERNSVTSSDIRDGSLRGVDFSPDTLAALLRSAGETGPKGDTGATGATGLPGATGAAGAPGPAGGPATLQSFGAIGSDISNYQDREPIVTVTAPVPGYYLAIASATVTNTGASNDYLNCGFEVAGTIAGAAGFETTAGNATSGSSVTLASSTNPDQTVTFMCMGSGTTTFDIANIKMKLIKLADQ